MPVEQHAFLYSPFLRAVPQAVLIIHWIELRSLPRSEFRKGKREQETITKYCGPRGFKHRMHNLVPPIP
jgi:hypothetical protein